MKVLQTYTWDIYFRSNAYPHFQNGKRFIDWYGTKILVPHVSTSPGRHFLRCAGICSAAKACM
ncbi:hypothetical protein PHMEG_0004079 [Phytophthora megakarya]|uniref:Uncharacterized protein n=1 Tax=Phytophthora megakarya TaxID=4795 RepID=A0A225WUL9_9STRA|nr:hypothetical protein PHMEG_0004079 [Phytophthora megakarya]